MCTYVFVCGAVSIKATQYIVVHQNCFQMRMRKIKQTSVDRCVAVFIPIQLFMAFVLIYVNKKEDTRTFFCLSQTHTHSRIRFT